MVITASLRGPGGGVEFVAANGGIDAHAVVGDNEVLAVELTVHDKSGAGRRGPRGTARGVGRSAAPEGVIHRGGARRHSVGVGKLGWTAGHGEALR